MANQDLVESKKRELIEQIDGVVESWNEENPERSVQIDTSQLSGPDADIRRMYRYTDRTLTLRLYDSGSQYRQLQRGPVIAGGTLGFTISSSGLNLLLLRDSNTGKGVWLAVDVSDNPLGNGGTRTHILANSEDELRNYSLYLENVAASLQVSARELSNSDIRELMNLLTG